MVVLQGIRVVSALARLVVYSVFSSRAGEVVDDCSKEVDSKGSVTNSVTAPVNFSVLLEMSEEPPLHNARDVTLARNNRTTLAPAKIFLIFRVLPVFQVPEGARCMT